MKPKYTSVNIVHKQENRRMPVKLQDLSNNNFNAI